MVVERITDISQVKDVLSACELPNTDVAPSESLIFFGVHDDSKLIAVIGLELLGLSSLLRSLAVLPDFRNNRVAKVLVDYVEKYARTYGIESLYLLTSTADGYFSTLGYVIAKRDEAPLAIQNTAQFSGICPSSAIFMKKQLSRQI